MKSALLKNCSAKNTLQRSYRLTRYLIRFSNKKLWISKWWLTMLGLWPSMNFRRGWCKRSLKHCKQVTSQCEGTFWVLKTNRPLWRTRQRTLTSKTPQRFRDSSKTRIVFNTKQSLWLKISTARYLRFTNGRWLRWMKVLPEKLLRLKLRIVDASAT